MKFHWLKGVFKTTKRQDLKKVFSCFSASNYSGEGINMQVEINLIQPEDTYEIRHKVLRPSQPKESVIYESDVFRHSFHLGAYKEGKLISIASFLKERHPSFDEINQYRLNGMATLQEFRGKGAGSKLLMEGEKILKKRHARLLWCNAKFPVSNYYTGFGLREHGEVFVIDSIGPHKLMYKKL